MPVGDEIIGGAAFIFYTVAVFGSAEDFPSERTSGVFAMDAGPANLSHGSLDSL